MRHFSGRRKKAVVLAASIAGILPGMYGQVPFASAGTVPNGGTLNLSGTAQTTGLATQVYNITPPGTVTGFNNINFLQTNAVFNGAAATAGTSSATVFYGAPNTTDPGGGEMFNAAPTAYGVTLASNYFARFSGYFNAPAAGNYTFGLNSDDGSVLYLDGVQIVNDNNYQGEAGTAQATSVVTLSAGQHDLVAGYYQGGGGAGITTFYQAPTGSPNSTALTAIPVNDGTNQILTGPQALVNFNTNGAPDPNVNLAAGTSGTLQIQNALQAQLGALTLNGGTSALTLLGSSVRFNTTTFTGGGTITFAPAGATLSGSGTTASPYLITNPASSFAQDIAFGQATDGGTAVTIVKTGYNSILLDNIATGGSADSFVAGTAFNIQGGSLVVNGSSTGSNPLSNAGVSLNAAIGVGSAIQNSTLTLASQGGNVTYDNPVTIGAGVTANIIAQQANQQTGVGPQIGVSGITSPSATSAFTATLGGVNSLSVPATSTLNLSSANGETLTLGAAFTLAANGTLNATGGTVSISNGGAVGGSFNNTGANLTIATTALTGAGTIGQSGGTTNVNIANPGFTGAVNLTGGATTFNVAGAFTAASGVNVNGGGSLTLATADSNSANVTVASGGTLQFNADQGGATPGTPPTAAIAGTLDINANQSPATTSPSMAAPSSP
jgi:hypothetical protein